MMYGYVRWPGTTFVRNHDGRQFVAVGRQSVAILDSGQPKGDGKISEIVEKQKFCSDIAEGEVETV